MRTHYKLFLQYIITRAVGTLTLSDSVFVSSERSSRYQRYFKNRACVVHEPETKDLKINNTGISH